ncbi:MAG: hypothetical protein Q8K04_00240 [Lutibacter sp.]|nr:hypothetical protein [Lutibacter sp.]
MKKIKFSLVIFLCATHLTIAQNTKDDIKVHKVWISLVKSSNIIKGNLYAVDENSVKIIDNKSFDLSNLQIISPSQIEKIKIRRKGKVGKGVWIGSLIGLGVGIFSGLVSPDDSDEWFGFSPGEKVIINSIFITPIGAGVGALIGLNKEVITINGDTESYKRQLDLLKSYSLMPNSKE